MARNNKQPYTLGYTSLVTHFSEVSSAVNEHSERSFILFLATAQRHNIDFPAVTWQPALRPVGIGGTAEVNRSLLNLQMSLVFKRVKPSRKDSFWVGEKEIFRTVEMEITILSHPKIRNHEHMIDLVGICWEFDHGSDKLWPVLVFEKIEFGDIYGFLLSETGLKLSFHARIQLCIDVGGALDSAHAIGNVLTA